MGVLVLSLAIVSVYWMSCSSLTSWLLCASFSRSPRNCCREREHRIGVSMRVSRSPLLVKHVHVLYGIVYSQTLPGFPNTWRKHIHDVRNMFKFCDCHLLHLTAEFVCQSLWRNPMFMAGPLFDLNMLPRQQVPYCTFIHKLVAWTKCIRNREDLLHGHQIHKSKPTRLLRNLIISPFSMTLCCWACALIKITEALVRGWARS